MERQKLLSLHILSAFRVLGLSSGRNSIKKCCVIRSSGKLSLCTHCLSNSAYGCLILVDGLCVAFLFFPEQLAILTWGLHVYEGDLGSILCFDYQARYPDYNCPCLVK